MQYNIIITKRILTMLTIAILTVIKKKKTEREKETEPKTRQ